MRLVPVALQSALLLACLACSGGSDSAREARLAERRRELREEIRFTLENTKRGELEAVHQNLVQRIGREADPILVKDLREAADELAGRLAEFRQSAAERAPRGSAALVRFAVPRDSTSETASASTDSLQSTSHADTSAPGAPRRVASVDALLREARSARARKQWVHGLLLLDQASADSDEQAVVLGEVRQALVEGALEESDLVLAQALNMERDEGVELALKWLAIERERFPTDGSCELFHRAVDGFFARARGPRVGAEPVAARSRGAARRDPPELPTGASGPELAKLAQAFEADSDLAGAREVWLAAAQRTPFGEERDEYFGLADDAKARLALRSELEDAFYLDARVFAGIEITDLDLKRVLVAGVVRTWAELSLEQIRRAASVVELSLVAQRGLLLERLQRGGPEERERALADLGRMQERGEITALDAQGIVARARRERAAGGWRFEHGRWVAGAEVAAGERSAELASVAGEFSRATLLDRERAWEAVVATDDEELIRAALETRWKAKANALAKGGTMVQLERLAEVRRELDLARKAALELIFDEEAYFYPYNPPQCPPDKAALYAPVQRRVDELVGAVQAVWSSSRPVKLPEAFRAGLEELAWNRDQQSALRASFDLPPKIPAFVFGLPGELEQVGLAEFAWNEEERATLAWSRKIVAHNERSFGEVRNSKQLPPDPASIPNTEEAEQVRVTNAYRAMLGRRALAWNARLQVAAQGHSEYMADTGDFGHSEKDRPGRATPFERMKLAGYPQGAGENCSMNQTDPEGTHTGWLHSSGHHRNILTESHREMASAIASAYWTQDFGADTAFEQDLDR